MYRKFVSNSHKPCAFKNVIFAQVSTVRNNEKQLGQFSVIGKMTTSGQKISV